MTPDDPRHGKNTGYLAGCRQQCCRDAAARKEKARRLDQLRGLDRTVPVLGAERRVHALQALGWPPRMLSAHIGMSEDWLHATIRTKSGRIYRHNFNRIVALYDEFSMKIGPSDITRRRAQLAGWAPPLAWDDIDDKDERPKVPRARNAALGRGVDEVRVQRVLSGENLPTTREEKTEIMRRWLASGRSERQLCKRMGWKEGRYSTPKSALSTDGVDNGLGTVGALSHSQDDERQAS